MVAIDDLAVRAGLLPRRRTERAERTAARRSAHAQPQPVHASWTAWGVTATVTVAEPRALPAARRLVSRQFVATEAAAARFRPRAEIHRLYRAGGRAITVSPLLAELVAASLVTAERTGGDVDPTVSAALTAASSVPVHDLSTIPVCATRTGGARPAPGWEQVHLHGRRLAVPAGTTLDLTATAKARACDRAAAAVADRLGIGVLVQLGSDAVAVGPAPQDGWTVPVQGRDGAVQGFVVLPPGTALATSHLTSRVQADVEAMRSGRTPGVHLIDPRTGRPPAPVWHQVSALGFSCLEATAYTAASLIRGTGARQWLVQLGVPARLVTTGGDVITAGPWAAHQGGSARNSNAHQSSAHPSSDAHPSTDSAVPGPRPANPTRTTLR